MNLYVFFSSCLSIVSNFSTVKMSYPELCVRTGRDCSLGLGCAQGQSDPTLTLAKMVKASGSSTRISLFSVPSTRHDTASSSARFFFMVIMVVMTVCRRTLGVTQGILHHPPDIPDATGREKEGKGRGRGGGGGQGSIRDVTDLCANMFMQQT